MKRLAASIWLISLYANDLFLSLWMDTPQWALHAERSGKFFPLKVAPLRREANIVKPV